MAMRFLSSRKKSYGDAEVVEGLQGRDAYIEEWFYGAAKRYFNGCFNELFFDKDMKQEIFQNAFIKLWTEIENGRIRVMNGRVSRLQRGGGYLPMTCSLNTFMMAFAKTEYRELLRNVREEGCDDFFDAVQYDALADVWDADDCDVEELKNQIVDECINQLSPSCIDILTLFYYQGKSLDEILEIRSDKNTSKDGLKSAKNKCMSTLRERVLKAYNMCNI